MIFWLFCILLELREWRVMLRRMVSRSRYLHLETNRASATTSTLELSALGDDSGLDARVSVGVVDGGAMTEMLDGLSGALGAAQEDGVGALGGAQGQLVQGEALTTSLDDAGSSSLGEAGSGDLQGGDLQQTRIVGDSAHDNRGLVLLSLHVPRQAGQRKRSSVDSRHSQSLGNGVGELGLASAADEAARKDGKRRQRRQVERAGENCHKSTDRERG